MNSVEIAMIAGERQVVDLACLWLSCGCIEVLSTIVMAIEIATAIACAVILAWILSEEMKGIGLS